jgi:hypothetical protein
MLLPHFLLWVHIRPLILLCLISNILGRYTTIRTLPGVNRTKCCWKLMALTCQERNMTPQSLFSFTCGRRHLWMLSLWAIWIGQSPMFSWVWKNREIFSLLLVWNLNGFRIVYTNKILIYLVVMIKDKLVNNHNRFLLNSRSSRTLNSISIEWGHHIHTLFVNVMATIYRLLSVSKSLKLLMRRPSDRDTKCER